MSLLVSVKYFSMFKIQKVHKRLYLYQIIYHGHAINIKKTFYTSTFVPFNDQL